MPVYRQFRRAKETPEINHKGGLMKNELFNELLKSMHEMDRIVQGELAPGRVIRFTEPEVKQIRMNTGLSQKQFAALTGIS